jgi:hypothetical protein
MEDIEIYDIDVKDNWSARQKDMFAHLEILTMRIIQKNKDITSNLGSDFATVYMTYATFGDASQDMFHKVCSLAKDYIFEVCQEKFNWAKGKANYKSLKKLCNILCFYEIDISYTDEKIEGIEELSIILPEGVDPNFVLHNGFYPYVNQGKTGYWFRSSERNFVAQSNFVISPLMHVISKTDNKRIIKINNGFKTSLLEIPSRGIISLEFFSGAVIEEGNFLFYGGKTHLMRVLNTVMADFPVCWELKTLGWQKEGFFAWSNAILEPDAPGIQNFDEIGITEVNGINYFSPAGSNIYSGQRSDDDEYENDRYLRYVPSKIDFETWTRLLCKVYPDHGLIGISFVFIGLFRDLIFKIDNNCPMLAAYGEKGSGKSKFAESLTALFLMDLQPFNLNHGTDFAFFNRLGRFRNCITWFDEFDDQAIREDRFQSIKGAYDGAGRERGKGTNKNKTEVSRVNSVLILTGQYISTRDDNAALTRCIVLPFTPNNERSPDLIKAYEQLKEQEKKGLTGILTELLPLRKEFESEYHLLFPETFNELRQAITEKGLPYKERVLRNYSASLNSLKIAARKFKFPFTLQEVKERCINDIVKLSRLISESDSLADFWNTILYLLDIGEITEGFHFRILHIDSIKIQANEGERERNFPGITKILILRIGTIHKLYLESFRKQTGKTGINMQSLELYIGSSKGFIGKSKSQRFTDTGGKSMTTSCHVFEYETLGIELEREAVEPEKVMTEIKGHLITTPEWIKLSGRTLMRYSILTVQTEMEGRKLVKTEIRTNMFDAEPTHEKILLTKNTVIVTGVLKITIWKDNEGASREKRTMDVHSLRLENEQISLNEPLASDAPF